MFPYALKIPLQVYKRFRHMWFLQIWLSVVRQFWLMKPDSNNCKNNFWLVNKNIVSYIVLAPFCGVQWNWGQRTLRLTNQFIKFVVYLYLFIVCFYLLQAVLLAQMYKLCFKTFWTLEGLVLEWVRLQSPKSFPPFILCKYYHCDKISEGSTRTKFTAWK